MTKKLTGRGGPGRGQGMKPMPSTEKKQAIRLFLSPDLLKWIAENVENRSRSKFIREAIREKIERER